MTTQNDKQVNSMLNACVSFVSKNGMKNLSLRSLAQGANMSARMLIHYFGTSDNLFGKIMHQFIELEKERADKICAEALKSTSPLTAFIEKYCFRLVNAKDYGVVNNIFEMYGAAILGNEAAGGLLDDLLSHWIKKVKMILPGTSDHQASMVISFANGLVFDLLATKDKKRVQLSIAEFVSMYQAKFPQ